MANIGWGQSTWGNNYWGGQLDVAVTETGVAGTGAIGTASASSVHVTVVTGVQGTTTLNNSGVVVKIPITFAVTGVEASMPFGGWGEDGFGQGNWGGIVAEGVPVGGGLVAGQVGTGAVGTVAVVGTGLVIETGVAGTGAIGSVLAGAGALVTETGMVGSTGLGNESVSGTALVTPSGVSSIIHLSGYSATTITKTVTVQVVSGANKYYIDGVLQQTQELFERNTYKFDQSDSSNNGHPFRFSTTSNGSHNSGSEYTTGVTVNGTPGQAGAYTQITVEEFAPTLYYYCTQHSGMGGTANTPFVYNVLPTTGAPVTGVVGTSALGSVTTLQTALILPTGASATSAIGTIDMQGSSVLTLTGVTGTGFIGEENVWGIIVPSPPSPIWTEIAA